MDIRLKKFLTKQHCLSLSVREPQKRESNQQSKEFCGGVYSASCFYAFDEENLALIIKSEPTTRHINLALESNIVGVNIAKSTLKLLAIKGAQIRAKFGNATNTQKKIYYQKFPYAKAFGGEIYALEIIWAKYTNNKAFGKSKIEFLRDSGILNSGVKGGDCSPRF